MEKLNLKYYKTVAETQNDPTVLKQEMFDLLAEVRGLVADLQCWVGADHIANAASADGNLKKYRMCLLNRINKSTCN